MVYIEWLKLTNRLPLIPQLWNTIRELLWRMVPISSAHHVLCHPICIYVKCIIFLAWNLRVHQKSSLRKVSRKLEVVCHHIHCGVLSFIHILNWKVIYTSTHICVDIKGVCVCRCISISAELLNHIFNGFSFQDEFFFWERLRERLPSKCRAHLSQIWKVSWSCRILVI